MPKPFLVFPWNRPFLPSLKRLLDRESARPGGAVPLIVSPTSRPWQYLKALYRREAEQAAARRLPAASRLMPRVVTLNELACAWHAEATGQAARQASLLDEIAVLYGAVKAAGAEAEARQSPFDSGEGRRRQHLWDLDLARFFPWGVKLARLMSELLENGIAPSDMAGLEGDVMDYAADLLAVLGRVHQEYLARLGERQLATQALMGFEAARVLDRGIPEAFRPAPDRPVFIAGFHTLTRTQNAILKALWQAGASVCLHSDPRLLGEGGEHWICRRHREWMADWGAGCQLADAGGTAPEAAGEDGPRVSFLAGYDLHSQLGRLAADLDARERTGVSAAVLLPNSALLMPVLHHLPERDKGSVNVTMGASLDETPAAQLARACMAVQITRGVKGDLGRYHWKELVALFQHPLLRCLDDDSGLALGPMLDRFCQAVRAGLRFTDPWNDTLRHEVFANRDLDRAALGRVLSAAVAAFAEASTPRGLGSALQGLCDFIRRRCPEQVRATASMDMEALHRIEHAVVPMLQGSLLADDELPLAALSSLLDGLLAHERIFFEPGRDRLVNLQVMGVLESSLLHFDKVYVVDATDDRLPGGKRRDPLLPDSLRAVIGLPALDLGDQETGYAVYRLARCAGEIHFYWQEGMGGSSLFDGKKFRSRFAEEFIWEREQQEGRIFAPGEPPLELAEARLVPMHPQSRILSLDAGTRALARMERLLAGPVSPTMLDEYLHCPAKFGFHRLARLSEMEEVNEGDDPSGVGTLIHEVLEQFHMRRLNQALERSEEEKQEIVGIFHDLLHDDSRRLLQDLPPESLAVLEAAAPPKLRSYIDRQPANALPCLLECSFAASVYAGGRRFQLQGRLDRLDVRGELDDDGTPIPGSPERLVILDYKTGKRLPGISRLRIWNNDRLFERIERLMRDRSGSAGVLGELDELLEELRQGAASVQLPAYVAIARSAGGVQILPDDKRPHNIADWPAIPVGDAAFVELAGSGEEVSFYRGGRGDHAEERQRALSRCHLLVKLVLLHMARARELPQARDELRCSWCPYAPICHS